MLYNKGGIMVILSSPSGAGKTTLVKLLSKKNNFFISTSHTTRKPRQNEINGKDYHFVTENEFDRLIKNDEFLEYAKVFDNFYGTTRTPVITNLEKNQNVIFDIDVIGGIRLKEYFKNNALSIFVKAPSVKELKKRLSSRNKDSNESIETRIQKAQKEIEKESKFDLSIINDDLDLAKKESLDAVQNFLSK